jgi:hypothetical protein
MGGLPPSTRSLGSLASVPPLPHGGVEKNFLAEGSGPRIMPVMRGLLGPIRVSAARVMRREFGGSVDGIDQGWRWRRQRDLVVRLARSRMARHQIVGFQAHNAGVRNQ